MDRKPRYHPSDANPVNEGNNKAPAPGLISAGASLLSKTQYAISTVQRLPAVIPSPGLQKGVSGGSQRSIDETFQMNPVNGSMSLAIPITTTQGRGEFGPDLQLSYNSGSGNGPFGLGWQLNISAITRKTSEQVPRYDDSDTFLLSGEDELVPLNNPRLHPSGFSIQSFQPRILGTPLQIECWKNLKDPTDLHWRTISGSNVTSIFGQSDESRIFDTNQTGRRRIFSWLLCASYDAFGNLIAYQYKEENAQSLESLPPEVEPFERTRCASIVGRAKYLKSVKYGNAQPNRSLLDWQPQPYHGPFHFHIILDYGDHDADLPNVVESLPWPVRQDRFSSCRSGFEVRWLRLCRRILIYHHFPGKLSETPSLVRSVSLQYDETPAFSFLASFTEHGHKENALTTSMESYALAPYTFQYSRPADMSSVKVKKMDTSNMPGLPTPDDDSWQWVDLHGEGAPGILEQSRDGSWIFRRNENCLTDDDSSPRFAKTTVVPSKPNQLLGRSAYFEDVNQDGNLELVCLDPSDRLDGFYHHRHGEWANYQNFTSIPISSTGPDVFKQIDLTGNGLADLMTIDGISEDIIWLENLGEAGFGPSRRTPNVSQIPQLQSDDPTIWITLADMTGDGRADIIRISPGKTVYWQNLSYGQFSQPNVMYGVPQFDRDTFSSERVRLTDINGSGTADLLYFPPSGGLHVYLNQAGNGWSGVQILQTFPIVNQLSRVSSLDLLGKGTSCVCWTGQVPGSFSKQTLYYIDLAPGVKPNCLVAYQNGCGSKVDVSYKSSNWYFLDDERRGFPWTTKVGFPVQCVDQVRFTDQVAGRINTRRFAYHDGYYDTTDKEFRGFGMVEEWDSELLDAPPAQFRQPPIRTKTWYHTGAISPASDRLYRSSSQSPFGSYFLADLTIAADDYEVSRALKGRQLRQEIFGDDGSPQARNPYSISDTSYQVIELLPRTSSTIPGAYRCVPRDEFQTRKEPRGDSVPLRTHKLVLETNDFNDVLKSLEVSYGCEKSMLPEGPDQCAQQETMVHYVENELSGPVLDREQGVFQKPMPCVSRKYRVVGIAPADASTATSFAALSHADGYIYRDSPEVIYSGQVASSFSSLAKIRIEEKRTLYRDGKFSRDQPLPLGVVEAYSVVHTTLDLLGGHEWLQQVFEDKVKSPSPLEFESFMIKCGYVKADSSGHSFWWCPSSQALYSAKPSEELTSARTSFYTPIISQDPFLNATTVQMDAYNLLATRSIDSMGNVTEVEVDYHCLSPFRIVDPNRNQSFYMYDPLGRIIAVARSGKKEETRSDHLNDTIQYPSEAEIRSFFENPTQQTACALIGGATSYRIYRNFASRDSGKDLSSCPTAFIDIGRRTHLSDGATANDLSIAISYLDGSLKELQTVTLTDTAGEVPCWNVSGWVQQNNKGNPVRTFQPSTSSSHEFVHPSKDSSPAVTLLYDPLARVVGTIYPDRSFTKVKVDNWITTTYDRGDTVLIQDPADDADIGPCFQGIPRQVYFPTWHSASLAQDKLHVQNAAKRSEVYSDTPDETYFDANGHPILEVIDRRVSKIITRRRYDVAGNLTSTIDGKERMIEQTTTDLLGRVIFRAGMDNGAVVSLFDCMDRLVLTVDSRNWTRRTIYDSLGRETDVLLSQDGGAEILSQRTTYGDHEANAEVLNLRGKKVCTYDQSGVQRNTAFDFKGNCTESTLQFAQNYKELVDWNSNPKLDSELYKTRQSYDAMDRVVSSVNADGTVTRHTFGVSGRLQRICWKPKDEEADWIDFISNMIYAADDQVEKIFYGNGVLASFEYDKHNRTLSRKTLIRKESKKILEDSRFVYDVMIRMSHTRDDSQQTLYFSNSVVQPTCSYTYDTIGRLATAEGREQLNASQKPTVGKQMDGDQVGRYREEYTYDDANNIKQVTHRSGPRGRNWTRRYEYEEESLLEKGKLGNRLSYTTKSGEIEKLSYAGEAGLAGNVTSVGELRSMTWDPFNKLRSCSRQIKLNGIPETTWYIYDNQGKRVRKVIERASAGPENPTKLRETLYLPDLQIFMHKQGDGSTNRRDLRSSLIKDDQQKLIAIVEASKHKPTGSPPLIRYQMTDRMELDDSGLLVHYEEFSPFGMPTFTMRRSKQEASRKYRFASYERDKETGLYYCNARYLAPWLGRWISPDPTGIGDGLNLFCYCGNDPVNYIDPSGTTSVLAYMKVMGRFTHPQQGSNKLHSEQSATTDSNNLSLADELEQKYQTKDFPKAITKDRYDQQQQDTAAMRAHNDKLQEKLQGPPGPLTYQQRMDLKIFDFKESVHAYATEVAILGCNALIDYGKERSVAALETRCPLINSVLDVGIDTMAEEGKKGVANQIRGFASETSGFNPYAHAEAQDTVQSLSEIYQVWTDPVGWIRDRSMNQGSNST